MALHRKRIAAICREFLDDVLEVAQIKHVVLMKFVRITGKVKEEPKESGDFGPGGITKSLLKA